MLYFFFLGLFQSLLTAVVLLRRTNKRPADLFLLLLVVCFAFHFLTSFLLYELVSNTYFRKGFMNFTLLAYGPLTLIFARKSKNEPGTSTGWWLLSPAVAWAIPYFAIIGLWLAGSFSNYTYLQVYNRSLLVFMGPLNIVCFLGALRIAKTYPPEQSATAKLLRVICITGLASVLFCLSISLYTIVNNIPFGLFHQVIRSIGASGVLIVCLAITKYALLAGGQRVFAIHSSAKTPKLVVQADKERQKEIYDQLANKVKEERLFLDPDLNMEKLVAATGYSRHQVSEVLNQYADISFYPFINQFRVEQVCEQMKKAALKNGTPSLNMLDLSYACGFKSKSSFNEYFRRFTGQTPSEYWGKLNIKEKKA